MSRYPTPTIRRWELGRQMRALREQAGVSAREAAKEIEVSQASQSKMESGRQAIRPLYVKLWAHLYGVTGEEREELLKLAEESNKREWYASLSRDVPDWFRQYLGYENAASVLHTYCSELVDGRLQTADYTRALAYANRPNASEESIENLVTLREGRQRRLIAEDPLDLDCVLNEAALRRPVGGSEVMGAQLKRIMELMELPGVNVQVLPFSAGAHPAMTSPFTMLGFQEHPEMNTVYLEYGRGALYLEGRADLDRYTWMYQKISEAALDPDDTVSFLTKLVSEM